MVFDHFLFCLLLCISYILSLGFPSVGKSTLLNKLTGTFSEVASYEFTTLTCVPGIIYYQGAKIQLLDLPGIIEGAKDGKGRGRQVIAVGRTCDLICIVLDSSRPVTHKELIEVIYMMLYVNCTPYSMHFTHRKSWMASEFD